MSSGECVSTSASNRARTTTRTPVEVAQGVVESLASEFEFEQSAERDYEVADRLAVAWGRTTLADRLATAKGGQVQGVHLSHTCERAEPSSQVVRFAKAGLLVDLGPDWMVLATQSEAGDQQEWIIPTTRVVGVHGVPEHAATSPNRGQIWSRRKLTQLLRPLTDQTEPVRVHSDLGCFQAQVVRVGSDYLDVDLVEVPAAGRTTLTLGFAAVCAIQADLRQD